MVGVCRQGAAADPRNSELGRAMSAPSHSPRPVNSVSAAAGVGKSQSRRDLSLGSFPVLSFVGARHGGLHSRLDEAEVENR